MKIARIFAVIFALLGLILMFGTAALCFSGLDAQVKADIPPAVRESAQTLTDTLNAGDLAGVEAQLYGSPKLGTGSALTGEAAAVWDIFCKGIACETASDVYTEGSSFAVDAVITVPDIASITDSLTDHAKALLNDRIAVAEKMDELYDENGEFRQDVIDDIMAQAVALALAEEPETLTFETTFGFAYRADQWYIVPDSAFIQALSGGLA